MEMGLISPGGQNLLDFLELWQVLSTYDRVLRDPLWWPQERPVPMRVARGPLGIPLLSMLRPKSLCGGPGTLGFLSCADMDLRVCLESPQGSQSSSRMAACTSAFLKTVPAVSRFPSPGLRDLYLSLEAFPRGVLTRLSNRAVPRATIL